MPKKVLGEGLGWDTVMPKEEKEGCCRKKTACLLRKLCDNTSMHGVWTLCLDPPPQDVGSVFPPLTSGPKRVTALPRE